VGYSHKLAKTTKHSQFARFTDSVVDELSRIGQRLILPELNTKVCQLFGFDFSGLLAQAKGKEKSTSPKCLKAIAARRRTANADDRTSASDPGRRSRLTRVPSSDNDDN
jgi:hypothetical protein